MTDRKRIIALGFFDGVALAYGQSTLIGVAPHSGGSLPFAGGRLI